MKLIAILVMGDMRWERDLAQHFMHVGIREIFPHNNESDAARLKWCTRAWQASIQIK